jgi:ribokinase
MNVIPKHDVIVCGSLHLDIVVHADRLPRIDETAAGSGWSQVCGGKGGNQAVQAAKFGAKTAMIGRIGNDAFGETLLKNLSVSGVETQMVEIDHSKGSGMSVAILESNGEYGAVIVSGSNLEIAHQTLDANWQALGGAKLLLLQNEIPHRVNVAAATCARDQSALVVYNAAPARPLSKDLLSCVDVLIVNRVEAEMITGLAVKDRSSALACLPGLGGDLRSVIITLGGEGLVVKEKSNPPTEIDALPVKVVSTHGAGDCFVGVLAACLANGQSLIEASRTANKEAAAFVSGKGQ